MSQNNYPKLNFKYSVNTDVKNAIDFINSDHDIEYKNWFLPEALRFVLDGKFFQAEIKKILREYTRVFYYINEEEIKYGMQDAIKQWKKVEKKYYFLVEMIFKNHPWPQGGYTCFPSIFNVFSAWENSRVFCFPYKKIGETDAKRIIAHEMLHIIFFDYVKVKYKITKQTKLKGKDQSYLWQVSEIFNAVIENWEPYAKIFCAEEPGIYPGTEKNNVKMRKQWERNQDIDWLLDYWLK
jgi:hypothetical protein